MRSAPPIEVVVDTVVFMRRLLAKIEADYRTFYELAYERTDSGTDNEGRSKGTVSRPVESIEDSKRAVRLQVARSAEQLRQAAGRTVGAYSALVQAEKAEDEAKERAA